MPVDGHPRRWWALAVLCFTLGMVALDNSILNVALPHIRQDLGATTGALQWITTAYALVLAGLLLPIAVVGDRRGRRGLLLVGLAVFVLASLLASLATTSGLLVVARGLMGLGGACAMPATLSIIGNIFPPAERPRAIAIWSATAGMTSAAGPVVGGVLLDHFWWGSVFLVNLPLGLAVIVGAIVLVPPSRDVTTPRVDRGSALAWWAALTAAIFAIIEGPERGFRSAPVLGAAVLAIVLLLAFRARERRTDGPLVDAATAADPRLWAGMVTMAALFLALLGGQFVATQWLQGPEGLGPLEAGLCFVPAALLSMLFGLLNPGLVTRSSERAVASAGLLVVGVAGAAVSLAVLSGAVPLAVLSFALLGAGLGLAAPSGAELIMQSAPPSRAGSTAGINETIVEASGALGVAVLGSMLAGSGSFARPYPVVTVVCVVGAFAVLRLLRPAHHPASVAVVDRAGWSL